MAHPQCSIAGAGKKLTCPESNLTAGRSLAPSDTVFCKRMVY